MSSVSPSGRPATEFNPRPLTDREREQVQRLLSDPFSFPPEFIFWIRGALEKEPPVLPVKTTYKVGPAGSGPGGIGRALYVD